MGPSGRLDALEREVRNLRVQLKETAMAGAALAATVDAQHATLTSLVGWVDEHDAAMVPAEWEEAFDKLDAQDRADEAEVEKYGEA